MSTVIYEVKCVGCGRNVEILEDPNHHEYVPAGTCAGCGLFYYVSIDSGGHEQINWLRPESKKDD